MNSNSASDSAVGNASFALDPRRARAIVTAIAQRLIAATDELTQLDKAIGDGDHGLNMKRGFAAVLAEMDSLAATTTPALFTGVGRTLVMKVGGASGPLYGTLFMQLGKSWPPELSRAALHNCLHDAVAAVAARGKSQTGQKTMLDVLVPVVTALGTGADRGQLRALAGMCAEATVPMEAVRGRASFLKERSIGHMDPGARSSQLLIEAVCDDLEQNA